MWSNLINNFPREVKLRTIYISAVCNIQAILKFEALVLKWYDFQVQVETNFYHFY